MRPTRPHQPPQPMPPGAHYGPPQAPRPVPTQAPVWREAVPTQAAQLLCPKCHGMLVTYERQGVVHLEQCPDCRGIWLDRGELDRLIDAEATFVEAPAYQPPSRQGSSQARWDDDDDRRRRDRDDDDEDDDDRRGRPSRRRSMFGELFEGLIE
jgi:uncharacterized protein